MDVKGDTATTFVYELVDDTVKVKRIDHTKSAAA